MERLNCHLADELAKGFALSVVAPVGASRYAPAGTKVREVALAPLWRFLSGASLAAGREACRLRPQWILAGSGLTAPLALGAARSCGARAAVYVHGLDVSVPHSIYRTLWLPALRRADRIIANSTATAQLAESVGVPPERITIVHPGVSVPTFDPDARARFRQRWGLPPDAPVLLSVGRLTARKGVREFVREVLPRIVQVRPDALLLIVGDVPKQALYAEAQTPQSILAVAEAIGLANHVRWLGSLFGEALTDAYFGADVHVFPVRNLPNDPEGFGMVAVEAAAHGLPTVAYATGGVTDAVADGISGHLVAPGDQEGFVAAVLRLLAQPADPTRCREFAQRFAWTRFGEQIRSVLQS
ncbi:glycosyltransferase family 4 protein [Tepidimonas taiwanensis]|nr:glycosyltransferase family 4 protein [Tepidimonas taiwanensis]UBQ04669.1 glycosyltransferase family 4 protein [Tepidimonas taiwanensis]